MKWDVVVVGAGAAGLLAGLRASERGRRTLVLEKNTRPGVKILMSGGTRCNLTHATDAGGIADAFGRQGRFLRSALAAFGPEHVKRLVESEGVTTKVEPGGKVFPASDKASDVVGALWRRLLRSGAEIALEEPLLRLERHCDGFQLSTQKRQLAANAVIVTTGGMSYPSCGTTGDGYAWAAELGHQVMTPRPALTPVITDRCWVEPLRGVTVPDVEVEVIVGDGSLEPQAHDLLDGRLARRAQKPLASSRSSFLFTHFGLSGPAVLNVSRAVSCGERPERVELQCDFLPEHSAEQLQRWLAECSSREGGKQVVSILAERLPRRLGQSLSQWAQLIPDRRIAEVPKQDRRRLVATIKRARFPVRGVMGFRKAEVTAGGVALSEVDSRSMQSKRVPRLYFAGEVLDLDGPIGGYNFQAAFSTGWLAGQSA